MLVLLILHSALAKCRPNQPRFDVVDEQVKAFMLQWVGSVVRQNLDLALDSV